MGMHLGGRTLGIVGMGRIGQAVARRARAIGMEVVFHNRSPKAIEGARQLGSLHEVMAAADVGRGVRAGLRLHVRHDRRGGPGRDDRPESGGLAPTLRLLIAKLRLLRRSINLFS